MMICENISTHCPHYERDQQLTRQYNPCPFFSGYRPWSLWAQSFARESYLKEYQRLGTMVHACTLTTWEAEVRGSPSSRPGWATLTVSEKKRKKLVIKLSGTAPLFNPQYHNKQTKGTKGKKWEENQINLFHSPAWRNSRNFQVYTLFTHGTTRSGQYTLPMLHYWPISKLGIGQGQTETQSTLYKSRGAECGDACL